MDWYQFYKNRVNSSYQTYFEKRYEPFLSIINQLKTSNGIQELGCGIGSVSKAIGGKYKGCDIDPFMVMLANENTNSTNFHHQSMFEAVIDPGALKVTHGVLEHFSDKDIVNILEKCPNSVHYVPTDGYDKPSFGDERLLSYKYWLDLATPTMWMLFNDDKDLVFVL